MRPRLSLDRLNTAYQASAQMGGMGYRVHCREAAVPGHGLIPGCGEAIGKIVGRNLAASESGYALGEETDA